MCYAIPGQVLALCVERTATSHFGEDEAFIAAMASTFSNLDHGVLDAFSAEIKRGALDLLLMNKSSRRNGSILNPILQEAAV